MHSSLMYFTAPSTRPTMTSSRGSHSLYEHTGLFNSSGLSLWSKSSGKSCLDLAEQVFTWVPAEELALLLATRVEHARHNCKNKQIQRTNKQAKELAGAYVLFILPQQHQLYYIEQI